MEKETIIPGNLNGVSGPKPEAEARSVHLDPVKELIESDDFLSENLEKIGEIKNDGKDTLRHTQRIANLGYMLAAHLAEKNNRPVVGDINDFVKACLFHDVGKTEIPSEHLVKPSYDFTEEDFEIVSQHAYKGYEFLKQKKISPRTYNVVLLHHAFQKKDYPPLSVELRGIEEVDVDNARLLAMVDVFDTCAFGRPHVEIAPLSRDETEKRLMEQFDQPGDEEIIGFLLEKYGEIKDLDHDG